MSELPQDRRFHPSKLVFQLVRHFVQASRRASRRFSASSIAPERASARSSPTVIPTALASTTKLSRSSACRSSYSRWLMLLRLPLIGPVPRRSGSRGASVAEARHVRDRHQGRRISNVGDCSQPLTARHRQPVGAMYSSSPSMPFSTPATLLVAGEEGVGASSGSD